MTVDSLHSKSVFITEFMGTTATRLHKNIEILKENNYNFMQSIEFCQWHNMLCRKFTKQTYPTNKKSLGDRINQ